MQQAILDDWFLRQDILDKLMGQDEEQAEAERYADRGLIPRTLSYIFGRASRTTTH